MNRRVLFVVHVVVLALTAVALYVALLINQGVIFK